MYDIIILGSGPAGFTAGIYAVRAGHKTLIIAGASWGGQLMLTTLVENYPGFAEGIQGPKLMADMRRQAERLGVEILNNNFTRADFSSFPFKITVEDKTFQAKAVIIATGADSLWLDIPGERKLRGKGVSVCATCDAPFFRGKRVIVVGGGDSAMEEALVLAKVAKSVTIIHRRDKFRASKAMQDRVFNETKIKIIWNTELIKYQGVEKLESVVLKSKIKNQKSKIHIKYQKGEKEISREHLPAIFGRVKIQEQKDDRVIWQLQIDGVFVAIGRKPNTFKLSGIALDAKGYVIRREVKDEIGLIKYTSATSVSGVFTAGDVHDYRYRQAITAAGFGCMAAMDADRWLSEINKLDKRKKADKLKST